MSHSNDEQTAIRVALLTNVLPSYRVPFIERVVARRGLDLTVYCQRELPGENLDLVEIPLELREHVVEVPYWHARRGDLYFQRLPGRRLLRDHDVVVVMGNPRFLSNVLWSLLLRLRGTPLVVYGHGHSAEGSRLTQHLRLAWWRIFDCVFAYTDPDAAALGERGFDPERVVGMNNGLDQREIARAAAEWSDDRLAVWRREQGLGDQDLLLSCARLVEKNRFELMIPVLARLREQGCPMRWVVVGDGPLRESLSQAARNAEVADQIVWAGEVYGEADLAPWFLSARVLVHPGSIGLTLLHAFGYGLPVVTSDDLLSHRPEIGALTPGDNGLLFRSGSADDLARTLRLVLSDDALRARMGQSARRVAEDEYNVDVMAERFEQVCRRAAKARAA